MFRRILCWVLVLLVVVAVGACAANALGWFEQDEGSVESVGNIRRLIASKSEYAVGEEIMVTAWSFTDSDQVVLYSLDGNKPVRWCRVGMNKDENSVLTRGSGSGKPVDIGSRNVPGAAKGTAWAGQLPAGEYVVYLASESGAIRYCSVPLTIVSK